MQGLKRPFVGIGIPGFSCGDVYALYTLALRSFHWPLEQNAESFYGLERFGGHAVVEPFVKHPFTHINEFIFQGNICGIEDLQNRIHDFRTYSIAFRYSYFHISYLCDLAVNRTKRSKFSKL